MVNSNSVENFYNANQKRLDYATWVDLEKKFFFMETPKVGCSTIKIALQSICGLAIPDDENQIHYRKNPEEFVNSLSSYSDRLNIVFQSDIFKFSFCRNPYDRLESAYKDKIVRSKGPFWNKYRKAIRTQFSLNDSDNISFYHFVNYVCSLRDSERDIHWRSQFSLLRPDLIKYDFIGRMEYFSTDLAYVLGRLKVDNYRKYVGIKANKTENSLLTDSYSPEMKSMVYSTFIKDFEFFDYKP